jgi:4-hydroxy 2-oxovalerate aldolase
VGIDPREILVELGRRKAVAGQEDWVVDVAEDLARVHQEPRPKAKT